MRGDKVYPRQGPCTAFCENIRTAGTSCTSWDCLCPTVFLSGAACSSCLVTVAMNGTQAAQVASLLDICANPDQCVPQCHSVAAAAASCGPTNSSCLCPTFLASAPSCIACVEASHTNPSVLALIESYLTTECLGVASASNSSATFVMASTTGSSASISAVSVTPTSTSHPASSSAAVASSGAWSPKFGAELCGFGYIHVPPHNDRFIQCFHLSRQLLVQYIHSIRIIKTLTGTNSILRSHVREHSS